MKLSIVIGTFYPATYYGGPIYSTYNLSKHLARLGVEVAVSTTNVNGNARLDVNTGVFLPLDHRFNVKYYGWSNKKSFSLPFILGIWKDIADSDVIFLQPIFSFYVPITLLYAKILSKPVLLSPRGSLGDWCLRKRSFIKQLWIKLLISPFMSSGNWHATSEQERLNILQLFPHAEVICISNGIHFDEFDNTSNESRDEYIFRFTKIKVYCNKVIVSMGRLHKVKGFDVLIKAFSKIHSKLNAILLIAGTDAGEEQFLKKLIVDLGVSNRVFLLGELTGQDKIDFLAHADIFALPSHHENFGNVYLESLAAGTPIIASSNTPWQEVETVGCGRWVEPTPDSFAKAMCDVISKDHRAMGLRGKAYVNSLFGWDAIARRFYTSINAMVEYK